MFAPALGILEDPATGGASGPLGCYLVYHKVFNSSLKFERVSEQAKSHLSPLYKEFRERYG